MNSVKLRNSGSQIDMSLLPSDFIDIISHVMSVEEDPYTLLAGYAYMINGMKVSELQDRFVLVDQRRIRIPSREYIRQKVVNFYRQIRKAYLDRHSHSTVSVYYKDSNSSTEYIYFSTEVIQYDEDQEKEDTIKEEDFERLPEEIIKEIINSDFGDIS